MFVTGLTNCDMRSFWFQLCFQIRIARLQSRMKFTTTMKLKSLINKVSKIEHNFLFNIVEFCGILLANIGNLKDQTYKYKFREDHFYMELYVCNWTNCKQRILWFQLHFQIQMPILQSRMKFTGAMRLKSLINKMSEIEHNFLFNIVEFFWILLTTIGQLRTNLEGPILNRTLCL